MKLLLSCIVLVSAAVGQQNPPALESAKKYVVPISIQMSGSLELRATGIRFGERTIVIPEVILNLRTAAALNVVLGDKLASRFASLGSGMVVVSFGGLEGDVPTLKIAPFQPGEQVAWYVGYRNGALISRCGKVTINANEVSISDSSDAGIGWGIFSSSGELIGIVTNHLMTPESENHGKLKFAVIAQSGASIMALAGRFMSPNPVAHK